MNDKAKKYFDSLKGKKVAFVGMGVANIPCAEIFLQSLELMFTLVTKEIRTI